MQLFCVWIAPVLSKLAVNDTVNDIGRCQRCHCSVTVVNSRLRRCPAVCKVTTAVFWAPLPPASLFCAQCDESESKVRFVGVGLVSYFTNVCNEVKDCSLCGCWWWRELCFVFDVRSAKLSWSRPQQSVLYVLHSSFRLFFVHFDTASHICFSFLKIFADTLFENLICQS